jgi:hypothetical protein
MPKGLLRHIETGTPAIMWRCRLRPKPINGAGRHIRNLTHIAKARVISARGRLAAPSTPTLDSLVPIKSRVAGKRDAVLGFDIILLGVTRRRQVSRTDL